MIDDPFARLRGATIWPHLVAGAQAAERGAWWDAHEAWEAAWRAYGEADRGVLQGLIQLVAANWHLERGETRAAAAVVARARRRLRASSGQPWPFALDALIAIADGLGAALARGDRPAVVAVPVLGGIIAAGP